MHHKFSDFLRNGGNAQYIFEYRDGRVVGRQSILSFKSSFPNYTALRADFSARLDAVIAENTRMLLRALTPPDTVPLFTEPDLRDVSDAKDEVLAQWDARLERIFAEYQTHPQRLRPLRTAMEERLLRAFAGAINQLRQEELGVELYIWHSQDDAKVRNLHAGYNDQVFRWDSPPQTACQTATLLPGASATGCLPGHRRALQPMPPLRPATSCKLSHALPVNDACKTRRGSWARIWPPWRDGLRRWPMRAHGSSPKTGCGPARQSGATGRA